MQSHKCIDDNSKLTKPDREIVFLGETWCKNWMEAARSKDNLREAEKIAKG